MVSVLVQKRGFHKKKTTISTLKADLSVKHTHNERIIKVVGIAHPREERLENFSRVDVRFAARFFYLLQPSKTNFQLFEFTGGPSQSGHFKLNTALMSNGCWI